MHDIRYWIGLTEAFFQSIQPWTNKTTEVFRNPTRREFREIQADGAVRAFLIGPDILVWSPWGALHGQVRRAIDIPQEEAIPVLIEGDYGKDAAVMVTDNVASSLKWSHSPKAADAILSHPWLRRSFRHIEVGYHDEAIYGDWRELPHEPWHS